MNPPEQAPALQQIYEARLELVRQNEAEIADLKSRLKRVTKKQKEMVAQMNVAKSNYEEASSKIVDLGDSEDEDESGDDNYNEGYGNESKYAPRSTGHRISNNSKEKSKQRYGYKDCQSGDEEDTTPDDAQHRRYPTRTKSPLKATPSNYSQNMRNDEVVDLLESDDSDSDSNSDIGYNKEINRSKTKMRNNNKKRRTNNSKESDATNRSHSLSRTTNEQPDTTENLTMQQLANRGDNKKAPTNKRPRSSSTNSFSSRESHKGNSVTVNKKRGASKISSEFTRRITMRTRPSDIPPEVWLKSSVGRTREELNKIDDMVQYMGSSKFGQSVVVSKFGKVYAVVLNDEWNVLAQKNDELQFWYVGLGPGRKRNAGLVGASQSTIPIFHAPKMEFTTKECFYVGHYKVKNVEELDPPVIEMEKERGFKVTFEFEKFDERLDSIIKKGPNIVD